MSELQVSVEYQYLPVVDSKPGYGVSQQNSGYVVRLSHLIPRSVGPLLEAALRQALRAGDVAADSAAQLVWALTRDFLSSQVIAGNLRWDRVAEEWRWFGPLTAPGVSDTAAFAALAESSRSDLKQWWSLALTDETRSEK